VRILRVPEVPGAIAGFLALLMAIFSDWIVCFRLWLIGAAAVLLAWTLLAVWFKSRAEEGESAELARERTRALSNETHWLTHNISPFVLEPLRKCEQEAETLPPAGRAEALRRCAAEAEALYRKRYIRGVERVLARYGERGLLPTKTTSASRARANVHDIQDVWDDLNALVEHLDAEIYKWLSDDD